jgi:bidirectional [NiFe] hydrogenase diaphorase subunit
MTQAADVKTLRINGADISARADQTIFEAARENNIAIPTLCHLDGLSDIGACRMCLVEVAGTSRLFPSCVTRVEEGMQISTQTDRLQKYRRMTLELLFAERNHVCSVCVSNGACELQSLGQSHGLTHIEFPYRFPKQPVDASHELFTIDHNRCILCTRCVRVCAEIEGAHTWDVMGRGELSRVITDLDQPWGESESCTSCGKCVEVCPTGALFEKSAVGTGARKKPEFISYLNEMRDAQS